MSVDKRHLIIRKLVLQIGIIIDINLLVGADVV